jgi:hypothetical protein
LRAPLKEPCADMPEIHGRGQRRFFPVIRGGSPL